MKRSLFLLFFILTIFGCAAKQTNAFIPTSERATIIACEPAWLGPEPVGVCTGAISADPRLIHGACTCANEEYLPIRTKTGRTCIHIEGVLTTLEQLHASLSELDLTAYESFYMPERMPDETDRDGIEMTRLKDQTAWLHTLILRHAPTEKTDPLFAEIETMIRSHARIETPNGCFVRTPRTSRRSVVTRHRPLLK